MAPIIWTVMSGVIATIATSPKASVMTFPPTASAAPIAIGSINVAVIGPLATPPESKAIPTNAVGTILDRARLFDLYEGAFNLYSNYEPKQRFDLDDVIDPFTGEPYGL